MFIITVSINCYRIKYEESIPMLVKQLMLFLVDVYLTTMYQGSSLAYICMFIPTFQLYQAFTRSHSVLTQFLD